MTTRSYRELSRLKTFEDRFEYLRLRGGVGVDTFGHDRYLNQGFYTSTEWRHIRRFVIARDCGEDLGVPGYEIHDKIIIHHMNPITPEEIVQGDVDILDPEYLITTTHRTHNAIHYGLEVPKFTLTERAPGDTLLW